MNGDDLIKDALKHKLLLPSERLTYEATCSLNLLPCDFSPAVAFGFYLKTNQAIKIALVQ